MPEPVSLKDWGRLVLCPAREAMNLTQLQLARAASVSLKSVNNIESGRHLPELRILARLCQVVGIANPLGEPESLSIRLDGVPEDRAREILRSALRDFISARADPDAFAQAHFPQGGVLQIEASQQAQTDAEDAGSLLLSLRIPTRSHKP